MVRLPVAYLIVIGASLLACVHCERQKTSVLLKSFGYGAIDHTVVSQGYILNLVQATNPAMREDHEVDKTPVLFLPAFFTNANSYLIRTKKDVARDLSDVDASQLSPEDLEDLLADDPAADSIVALLLNFGHEVWLLNRRGSHDSLGHVDKDRQPFLTENSILPLSKQQRRPKFLSNPRGLANPKYWNFSFDEQALYDVPKVIKYILNHSDHQKVALVGLSAGGALTLMTLSAYPELADKSKSYSHVLVYCQSISHSTLTSVCAVSHAIVWAPAFSMVNSILTAPAVASKTLEKTLIKFPSYLLPEEAVSTLSTTFNLGCQSKFLCVLFQGLVEGRPGLKQAAVDPKLIEQILEPASTHEYVSLVQASLKKFMHRFDYRDAKKNQLAYGAREPPAYELARLNTTNLYVFNGAYDSIVPPEAVNIILSQIKGKSSGNGRSHHKI